MILTQIARSRFKQSKLSAHPTYLRFGLLLWQFFWCGFLGINSFSQRRSETYENTKLLNVVLKLELEVKIGRRKPNSCPTTCFKTFFFF